MSGIVGFINLDREPADPDLLDRLCRPLTARSPDSVHTWHRGAVGMGHADLAIESGVRSVNQPTSLDDKVFVTADALLCGRAELVDNLRRQGLRTDVDAPSSELILQAHRAFGDDLSRHLVGDFAFAIWDEDRQQLTCVRDHLGVRPFFYFHTDRCFVFASEIGALLAHPAVVMDLDDDFIADFLLFGSPLRSDATVYENIRRLPPAHCLVVRPEKFQLRRYWRPFPRPACRHPRIADYAAEFGGIFKDAVCDRIPRAPVALQLSGGMDSSAIAAIAAARAQVIGHPVNAYVNTCSTLLPEDPDGLASAAVADYLNIKLEQRASEDYALFDRFRSPELATDEPCGSPNLSQQYDNLRVMSGAGCRVLLTGQIGDTLFAGSDSYLPGLLRRGKLLQFIREAKFHYINLGTLAGTGLGDTARKRVRKLLGREPYRPLLPSWLNPEFAKRVDFEQRWATIWALWAELNDVEGQLQRTWFSQIFNAYEVLKIPVVVRHPFSDIRLVEFALTLPKFAAGGKRVMRQAMIGMLPAEILARPKRGLPGDLNRAKLENKLCAALPSLQSIDSYIDPSLYSLARQRYAKGEGSDSTWSSWLVNYPIALAHWMNNNSRHAK